MLNAKGFSNLRIYTALLSNKQISILEYQDCLANFIAFIYAEGRTSSVLQHNIIVEHGGEKYMLQFSYMEIYFSYVDY